MFADTRADVLLIFPTEDASHSGLGQHFVLGRARKCLISPMSLITQVMCRNVTYIGKLCSCYFQEVTQFPQKYTRSGHWSVRPSDSDELAEGNGETSHTVCSTSLSNCLVMAAKFLLCRLIGRLKSELNVGADHAAPDASWWDASTVSRRLMF